MYIQSHVHHFPPGGCDAPERRELYSRVLKARAAVDEAVATVASQDDGPFDLNHASGRVSLYEAAPYRSAELSPGSFKAELSDGTRLGYQATADKKTHYEFRNRSDWLHLTLTPEGTTVVEKTPVEPPAPPEPVQREDRLIAFCEGVTGRVFARGRDLVQGNHALAAELGLEKDAESRRLAINGYTCAGLMVALGFTAALADSIACLPMIAIGMGMGGLTNVSLASRQHQLAGQVDQARREAHLAEFEAFLADPSISKV